MKHVLAVVSVVLGILGIFIILPPYLDSHPIAGLIISGIGLVIALITIKASKRFASSSMIVNGVVLVLSVLSLSMPNFL